jgi:hypothetical protein
MKILQERRAKEMEIAEREEGGGRGSEGERGRG